MEVEKDTDKMKIELSGYSVIEKTVRKGTRSSGRVHVPLPWLGKKVKVILLEPVADDE